MPSNGPGGPALRSRWTGPRIGAWVWILGSVQFVLGMAVTQLGWTTPYSLRNNLISDLGAVHCAFTLTAPIRYVCSPWHELFDLSAILLGILFILGTALVRPAFPKSRLSAIGLAMVVLAGIGSMGVGLSPEDVDLRVHSLSALIAFLLGNSALLVLGAALRTDPRWGGYDLLSFVLGAVGLIALGVFATGDWGWLGAGGWERLTVLPLLVWGVVVGARLLAGASPPTAERSSSAVGRAAT